MQSNLFDDLKSLKAKMVDTEKEQKEKQITTLKREKEEKLQLSFERFMQHSGVKKRS